jgi:acetylornithine/succinyldiaminopimelate/putrescine aminotransferase
MSRAEMAALVARFERHVNKGQVRYLRAGHLDVVETERNGVQFVDPASGKRMFDCFSSAGSFNVGRHNPVVMQALEEALAECDLGTPHLNSRWKDAFREKLLSLAPAGLDAVHFASGGGDAVDAALKLARGATGRSGVIATVKAYHGHTGFSLSANGKKHYRHYCEPLMPGFSFVPFNDLKAMRDAADDTTAAIIVEPVQGEAGIFPGEPEYLRGLRQLCDQRGILLIFDEIQTGFGRTGKLFACQHAGVTPDLMTVAKSIGGGLFPNAALLYRNTPEVAAFLDTHPDFHPSSTGGSDLGCRVSLRVLEYVIEADLPGNAALRGAQLQAALEEIRRENPKIIKEVRGIGLMVGLEYTHEFMGPMMAEALARQGVFAVYSGNAPQVMRFMAPISVTEDEVREIVEAIRAAVRYMKTLLPAALLAVKIPGVLKLLNNERVQMRVFGVMRSLEDRVRRKG